MQEEENKQSQFRRIGGSNPHQPCGEKSSDDDMVMPEDESGDETDKISYGSKHEKMDGQEVIDVEAEESKTFIYRDGDDSGGF